MLKEKPLESGPRVRVIGDSLPYRDSAEERLLELFRKAEDLSSTSDELAAHIDDWPSRYHLSPLRSQLLRPFAIGPGARVLEVGAGSGAISRYLGETGARVVALEGNLARAEAAAERCRDLPRVEVLCGPLESLEDDQPFDLVVVVGVLEYAGAKAGGGGGPERFLADLKRHLGPGGALILAIENALGLKYLLGHPEDHLGQAWASITGYPGDHGIRTFSRNELGTLLDDGGFASQRWLYPFPDYKMPRAVITGEAYAIDPDPERATDFVDQLVRWPTALAMEPSPRMADERQAHRTFLRAGLGPEVANSFLVCAATSPGDLDRWLEPKTLAWCFSGERQSAFRRMKTILQDDAGQRASAKPLSEVPAAPSAWLEHRPSGEASYIHGKTLEQLALDACQRDDKEALAGVLRRWSAALAAHEQEASPSAEGLHPLLGTGTRRRLPPRFVDVELSNFVLASGDEGDSDEEEVRYIDDEWQAVDGVEGPLVRLRALWYLARDLIASGAHHPFADSPSVRELTAALGKLCEVDASSAAIDRLLHAEAAFMAPVNGDTAEEAERHLRSLGTARRPPREADAERHQQEGHFRDRIIELQDRRQQDRQAFDTELAVLKPRLEEFEARLNNQAGYIGALENLKAEHEAKLAEAAEARARLEAENQHLRAALEPYAASLPKRLLAALRRGAR